MHFIWFTPLFLLKMVSCCCNKFEEKEQIDALNVRARHAKILRLKSFSKLYRDILCQKSLNWQDRLPDTSMFKKTDINGIFV